MSRIDSSQKRADDAERFFEQEAEKDLKAHPRDLSTIAQHRYDPESQKATDEALDRAYNGLLARMAKSGALGRMAGAMPTVPASVSATAAAGAHAAAALEPKKAAPGNDEILYVGMNPDSNAIESRSLGSVAKTTRVDGQGLPALATPADVKAYVGTLDLPKEVAEKVEAALLGQTEGREELAQIAKSWSAAYHGGTAPSRIVLSGHSTGDSVWGEGKAGHREFSFAGLQSLAKAMPEAAAQVKHVQFAGCFTYRQMGVAEKRDGWLAAFPKLETMWGYASKSPPAPLGQLQQWQKGTRGASTSITSSEKQLPPGVASWDRAHGYRANAEPLADLQKKKAGYDKDFEALLAGRPEITGHYDPRADGPYQVCRKLEGRPDLPASVRAEMHDRGDTYLRLRFYDGTRSAFAEANQAALAQGYRALGMDVPDFGSMGRAKAMAAIRDTERAMAQKEGSLSPEQRAAVQALRDRLQSFARLDGRY